MNAKVLLVDDEPLLLTAMSRRLGRRFDIVTAGSSAAALDRVDADGPFAAIVSDVQMPGMDGLELMRRMRSRAPGTVRLILTGGFDFASAVAAVGDGTVARFHTKPVPAADLGDSIEAAMLRHQLDRAAELPVMDARTVAEFGRALDTGQLSLYVQPQLALEGDRISAAEALIRWIHPERGVLAPAQFLGIAAAGGLMPKITRWVLGAACSEARRWGELGLPPVRLAVNLSAADLDDPALPGDLRSLIDRSGIAPDRLAVEVGDRAVRAAVASARPALAAFAALGVGVAIDGFGSGGPPSAWPRDLAIDVLKIDRMFVADIAAEPEARRAVAALAAQAREQGLEVVAEGVETAAQQDALARAGCKAIQGHLLARPMPAADFPEWLGGRARSVGYRGDRGAAV